MNSIKGQVEVEICGDKYLLTPDFEALLEIEAKAECSLPSIIVRASQEQMRLKDVVAIIYGGLKGTSKKDAPSYQAVGQMVMKHGLVDLMVPTVKFLHGALYPAKEEGEKETEKKT
jgi:hypothetical protein